MAQFMAGHSLLLTRGGQRLLARLAPHGRTLATTTYATIASAQLLALFVLWTPSGTVWWQAEGGALWALGALYLLAWGLLTKASVDAGAEVQSGLLGWWSLWRGRRPVFPPMPETGLFRLIRQPIYVSFALTLWLVPGLDTRPAVPRGHADRILPAGAAAQGTPLRPTLRRGLGALPRTGALCPAAGRRA